MMNKKVGLAIVAAMIAQSALGAQPETRPAPETSSSAPAATTQASDIDLRDYCTVLLALKLQDHLRVTDDQRTNLADIKIKLAAYLNNAAGNIRSGRVTPGLVAARAETVLGMVGKMVRAELTTAQRATLAGMFDAKTLEPIQVGASVTTENGIRSTTTISGIQLTYTHFGDTSAVRATSGPSTPAAPHATTSPTTPTTGPVPGSPRSRRDEGHVDMAKAVAGLQSSSAAEQVVAASQLTRAVPDDTNRPKVLELLRPAVKDTGDEHWLSFALAYCVWADAKETDTVKATLKAADQNRRMHQKEQASAAACTAMVRLDPKAAVDAINERIANDLFRVCLISDLQQLSKIDGPAQPLAIDIFNQLMKGGGKEKITLNP